MRIWNARSPGAHQVVNHQGHFDVGGVGRGADQIEIALPEFAVAAVSRVFAAPHRSHGVALERDAQLPDILRREAGERHRQIEAEGHIAAAVIDEPIDELVRLLPAFAQQDFRKFEGRGVDRREAIRPAHVANLLEQAFAGNHHFGKIVAKSLQGPRLNQFRHETL